jgi:hypothetical protein
MQFWGKFELHLRRHEDTSHSPNPGLFRGSLELGGKLVESVKTNFLNSTVFRGTAKMIKMHFQIVSLRCVKMKYFPQLIHVLLCNVRWHNWCFGAHAAGYYSNYVEIAVHEKFWGFFNPKTKMMKDY